MPAMKNYVCVLVIALVHRAICFPIGEPLASVGPHVPSLTPEMKGAEPKSDAPITPPVAGVLPEKADVVAPVAPPQKEETVSPSPTPAAEAKEAVPAVVPSSSTGITADEPSATMDKAESVVKSNADAVKSEVHTPEVPVQRSETTDKIVVVEQVAVSSEQPKEANNQVNSVSVDEPKPVRNEVKSEIPKEEKVADEQIKIEKIKDEKAGGEAVKSEAVADQQAKDEKVTDEVKSAEKVEAAPKNANAVVANSGETPAKPVSSEESVRKGGEGDASSSEEKNASVERVVMSDEKRESDEKKNESGEDVKRESSSEEAKEDTIAALKPAEKPTEELKKEEKKEEPKKESAIAKDEKKELREEVSSVKPIAESPQAGELAKPSTVVAAAAPATAPGTSMDAVTEKVDVIKREAAKDKHDEKKSTEIAKKDKSKVGSSAQKDDEIKSSKGQDKIVN